MLGRVSPVTRVTLPACRAHYPGGPRRVRPSVASPPRAAFPEIQAGRRPRLHFRGLLRLHSRYGPSDRSTARGGLRHEASTRPVAQASRSSATRSTDNSLGRTFLHWRRAPSGRTELSRLRTKACGSPRWPCPKAGVEIDRVGWKADVIVRHRALRYRDTEVRPQELLNRSASTNSENAGELCRRLG